MLTAALIIIEFHVLLTQVCCFKTSQIWWVDTSHDLIKAQSSRSTANQATLTHDCHRSDHHYQYKHELLTRVKGSTYHPPFKYMSTSVIKL